MHTWESARLRDIVGSCRCSHARLHVCDFRNFKIPSGPVFPVCTGVHKPKAHTRTRVSRWWKCLQHCIAFSYSRSLNDSWTAWSDR